MYKLEFTLKQHTPIIHFQHDQDGATLRATEVKPKLDRFIIEKYSLTKEIFEQGKNKIVPKEEFKKYFINGGKQHLALDYKLIIDPNNDNPKTILDFHRNAPMYFGNMGAENLPKHFKFIENTICQIISTSETLLSFIEKKISDFFFKNNFGTRQSKGYGSFTVITINSKPVTSMPVGYNFYFNLSTDNYQNALYQIGLFYKAIRSGINEVSQINYSEPVNDEKAIKQQNTISKFYFKSLIFLYSKHLNKQWDKKTIKQKYFNFEFLYRKLSRKEKEKFKLEENSQLYMEELALEGQMIKHGNSDILTYSESKLENEFFLDFKDVFGLSSSEEWKSYGKSIIKVNAQNDSTPVSYEIKNKNSIDFIERFMSPLLFKPILNGQKFDIYVYYHELPGNYIGQKFIIYNNRNGSNPKLCLQIPNTFTFNGFFNFIFDSSKFEINSHITNEHKKAIDQNNFNLNYFDVLNNIFKQLQINRVK